MVEINEVARLEAEWIRLVRESNAAYFAAKDEAGYREAMALMEKSRKAREALTRARKENDA